MWFGSIYSLPLSHYHHHRSRFMIEFNNFAAWIKIRGDFPPESAGSERLRIFAWDFLCLFNFHIVDADNLNLSISLVWFSYSCHHIFAPHTNLIKFLVDILFWMFQFSWTWSGEWTCVRWREKCCAMMWMMRVVCAPLTFHHPSSNRLIVIKQLTEILFQVFEVHFYSLSFIVIVLLDVFSHFTASLAFPLTSNQTFNNFIHCCVWTFWWETYLT